MKPSAAATLSPMLLAIAALTALLAIAPAQEPDAQPATAQETESPGADSATADAPAGDTPEESSDQPTEAASALAEEPESAPQQSINKTRAFIALGVGVAVVLGLIIVGKVNAFLALITAALAVSLLAPGELPEKIKRVAEAFGSSAGEIGIVIALAAVIGDCMLRSGAADRIVRAFLAIFGEKRSPMALMGSGFVLAIPVFFDTVFYLLVPLARSLHRKTGREYLKYILAIGAGGAITHTLVPPTPGPLVMAENLGFEIGIMIMVGLAVALPAAIAGLICGSVMDRLMPIPMRQIGNQPDPEPLDDSELPSLFMAILPVALPVLLISSNTIIGFLAEKNPADGNLQSAAQITGLIGNANLALLLSTVIAMSMVLFKRGVSLRELGKMTETSLLSGGVIILITAGGGAFGAMLKQAQVGNAIESIFRSENPAEEVGISLLVLAFTIAAVLKVAQGSSTVAMITGSSMLAGATMGDALGFHPVYLATAIGAGSLIGSWMNDSGFWIFAKMGGLTEVEALKSWTVMLLVLGSVSFAMTLLLATVVPEPLALFGGG